MSLTEWNSHENGLYVVDTKFNKLQPFHIIYLFIYLFI